MIEVYGTANGQVRIRITQDTDQGFVAVEAVVAEPGDFAEMVLTAADEGNAKDLYDRVNAWHNRPGAA